MIELTIGHATALSFWQSPVAVALIALTTSLGTAILTNWLTARRVRNELYIRIDQEIRKARQEIEHKAKLDSYLKVLEGFSVELNAGIRRPLATMPVLLLAEDKTVKDLTNAMNMARDPTSQAPLITAIGEFILQMRKEVLGSDTSVAVEDIMIICADERRTQIWREEQERIRQARPAE